MRELPGAAEAAEVKAMSVARWGVEGGGRHLGPDDKFSWHAAHCRVTRISVKYVVI